MSQWPTLYVCLFLSERPCPHFHTWISFLTKTTPHHIYKIELISNPCCPPIITSPVHLCVSHHDSEDVLGAGLVIQPLSSVHRARVGVDAEQTQAGGVDGAVEGVGQAVVLITVWGQHLDHLCVWGCVLWDGDIIGGLGESGRVVIVVKHGDVDLEGEEEIRLWTLLGHNTYRCRLQNWLRDCSPTSHFILRYKCDYM